MFYEIINQLFSCGDIRGVVSLRLMLEPSIPGTPERMLSSPIEKGTKNLPFLTKIMTFFGQKSWEIRTFLCTFRTFFGDSGL